MVGPKVAESLPPELVSDAMFENSFKSLYSSPESTGFRPPSLRYRVGPRPGFVDMASEFLVSSRLLRQDREVRASIAGFFFDAPAIMAAMAGAEPLPETGLIALEQSVPLRMPVGDAIRGRRSVRKYSGAPVSLAELGTILGCSDGVTAVGEAAHPRGGRFQIEFRAAPSGGALYPLELYLVALKVTGLAEGVYRHVPRHSCLIPHHAAKDTSRLLSCFWVGENTISLNQAAFIVVLVARPARSTRKYGPRGLRNVFLEAGAISENMHLAATALGVGSVDCSSVYDDELHEALALDGVHEAVVHTVVFGSR
jgi:SagB-type dehydrogenase family enzyme